MKLLATFICLSLFPVVGLSEIVRTAEPSAKGLDLYWWPKLRPLQGWQQDLRMSREYNVNALAPKGNTFAQAETVMYAKASYKKEQDSHTLNSFIEADKSQFKKDFPGTEVREINSIRDADNRALRCFVFVPAKKGNWERVAYLEEGDYYLVFTVSSRNRAGYEKSLPDFLRLVNSYKK
jgi:hypothetical protein